MTTLEKLEKLQNEELQNGFQNGDLWNDLEDIIYKMKHSIENVEPIQVDAYGSHSFQERKKLGLQ